MRVQQKIHEAQIAEIQAARQQVEDTHKEVSQPSKKVAEAKSPPSVAPSKPEASKPPTVTKQRAVASKPSEKPQRKADKPKPKASKSASTEIEKPRSATIVTNAKPERLKPVQKSHATKLNAPPVAERPMPKAAKKPKAKQIDSAENTAPIKEDAEPSAPQARRVRRVVDEEPRVLVAASELAPEFEPALELAAEPEMPGVSAFVPYEDIAIPRPERVLVHDEAGLHFVEPSQEESVDLGAILLQDARDDLGILPPAPEKPVDISDIFKMPEINPASIIDTDTTTGIDIVTVSEKIQPKTVEVLDIIQERVESLEPERVEAVEVLLLDLQQAIDVLDAPSEEVSAEVRLQLVTDTVTEILDILDIPYDEEIIAEIIVFLRAKQKYQYSLTQQETAQYFEEGTHERLSHVTNLFKDMKDLLEPLHTRLGRTALVSNIF